MAIEFRHPVTVHKAWGDLDDPEIIAVFEYESSADDFCRAILPSEPKEVSLIRTNSYNGSMRIHRRPVTD